MMQWGYLRETTTAARNAGVDPSTGLCRTGLNEYLQVIFPDVVDWVHDKGLPKERNVEQQRIRPDYRSESRNLIVEFDGIQHFLYPNVVLADFEKTKYYQSIRYEVVRIPYFIQLTKEAVKKIFDVTVAKELFDIQYPSLTGRGKWMPSHICPLGLIRMALEFVRFQDQYQVNKCAMEKMNEYSGVENLDGLYIDFKHRFKDGIRNPAELLSTVINCRLNISTKISSENENNKPKKGKVQ